MATNKVFTGLYVGKRGFSAPNIMRTMHGNYIVLLYEDGSIYAQETLTKAMAIHVANLHYTREHIKLFGDKPTELPDYLIINLKR